MWESPRNDVCVKDFTVELRLPLVLICDFIGLQLTNKDIADSIDAEMDGDLQKAFMTIGMQIMYHYSLYD